MSRASVVLLTFGSGRRELGFDVSLGGADKISTSTSGRRVLKPHGPSVLAGRRLAATSWVGGKRGNDFRVLNGWAGDQGGG